jgi:hypothetical protein
VIYLTAFGLGAHLRPWLGSWVGLRWYLGLLLIPIALVLLNLGLMVPLHAASSLVALIAIAGWGRLLLRPRRGFEGSSCFLHPIFVLPLCYLALSRGFRDFGYFPSQWDELNHWLLMPQQILLIGRATSVAMPFTYYRDYTPGWPLLIAYPFLLLHDDFRTHELLWLPFLSSAGVLGAFFDYLRRLHQEVSGRSRIDALVFAWAGSLVLAAFGAAVTLSPTNLVIEPPLENAWAAMYLLLIVAAGEGPAQHEEHLAIAAGIILAGGYLLKKPYLTVIPVSAVLCWALTTQWGTRRPSRSLLVHVMVGIFGPVTLVALVWKMATLSVVAAFPLFGERLGREGFSAFPGQGVRALLASMWDSSATLLQRYRIATGATATGLVGLILFRRYRVVPLAWFSWAAIYLAGLFWLYFSAFPTQHVLDIPSFDRYATSLGRLAMLAVLASIWSLLPSLRRVIPRLAALCLIVGLLAAPAQVLRATMRSLRKVRVEYGFNPDIIPYFTEGQQIVRLIRERHLAPARLVLIAQGNKAPAHLLERLVNYYSLGAGRQLTYRVVGGPVFGPTLHVTAASAQNLKHLLHDADVVWPVELDPWMLPILRRSLDEVGCAGPLEDGLLVFAGRLRGRPRFTCVTKERRLSYPELQEHAQGSRYRSLGSASPSDWVRPGHWASLSSILVGFSATTTGGVQRSEFPPRFA